MVWFQQKAYFKDTIQLHTYQHIHLDLCHPNCNSHLSRWPHLMLSPVIRSIPKSFLPNTFAESHAIYPRCSIVIEPNSIDHHGFLLVPILLPYRSIRVYLYDDRSMFAVPSSLNLLTNHNVH